MPIVTEQLLESGKSFNGGWSSAQLKSLGVESIRFNKGWKSRLLGTKVTHVQVDEFLRLKNRHLSHKSRKVPLEKPLYKEIYSHMDSIRQEIRESKKHDCSTCIHGFGESCTDRPVGGCNYYYNAKTDEHGPAYAV